MSRRSFWLLAAGGVLALALAATGGTLWYLETPHCPVVKAEAVISGGSLAPLVADGATLTFLRGYYACHEVQRNDLVAFRYAPEPKPLAKIVAAVPGDTFHLEPGDAGLFNIIVNGRVLRNSNGDAYLVTPFEKPRLDLYIKDDNGILPPRTYLLLGDLASGSKDSREFGLVDLSDILGKLERG